MLAAEGGGATAEFAVVLPAVVVAIVLLIQCGTAELRRIALADATADAARLVARGEDHSRATALVARVSREAETAIVEEGELVCVTASAPLLLGIRAQTRSCALAGGL